MNEKTMLQAKRAYATLCQMLDNNEISYKKDISDEKLLVSIRVQGEDLPMQFRIVVDPERMMVLLYSPLTFGFSQDNLKEGALAICLINDSLIDGNFDLEISEGRICYRMSLSFRESLLSEEAFYHFLGYANAVVEEYNDKLLMVAKGVLSLQHLKELIQK